MNDVVAKELIDSGLYQIASTRRSGIESLFDSTPLHFAIMPPRRQRVVGAFYTR